MNLTRKLVRRFCRRRIVLFVLLASACLRTSILIVMLSISSTIDNIGKANESNESRIKMNWIFGRQPSLKLPLPVIVVGFPKSGTTSIHKFFVCSGLLTQHFCCCGDISDHSPCTKHTMAMCILRNMANGRSLLEQCGDYQVYSQLDGERPTERYEQHLSGVLLENGTWEAHNTETLLGSSAIQLHFLPQHFHLEELHQSAPNATYVLPLRDANAWANSVFNWFSMRGRVINEYIHYNNSIERPGKARAREFLATIYNEHTRLIRDFVRLHPSHTLIEINLTHENAGKELADRFGLDQKCWGHHNKIGNRAKFESSTFNNLSSTPV